MYREIMRIPGASGCQLKNPSARGGMPPLEVSQRPPSQYMLTLSLMFAHQSLMVRHQLKVAHIKFRNVKEIITV